VQKIGELRHGCRVPKCDMDVAVVVLQGASGGVPSFFASPCHVVLVVVRGKYSGYLVRTVSGYIPLS